MQPACRTICCQSTRQRSEDQRYLCLHCPQRVCIKSAVLQLCMADFNKFKAGQGWCSKFWSLAGQGHCCNHAQSLHSASRLCKIGVNVGVAGYLLSFALLIHGPYCPVPKACLGWRLQTGPAKIEMGAVTRRVSDEYPHLQALWQPLNRILGCTAQCSKAGPELISAPACTFLAESIT